MFGRRLKELRVENGLTQRQLAVILECTQVMICYWEREECEPTESVIRRTALYFDVTADYLLGLEDETGGKIYKNIVNTGIMTNNSINIK